jgi:hypothetical protein
MTESHEWIGEEVGWKDGRIGHKRGGNGFIFVGWIGLLGTDRGTEGTLLCRLPWSPLGSDIRDAPSTNDEMFGVLELKQARHEIWNENDV